MPRSLTTHSFKLIWAIQTVPVSITLPLLVQTVSVQTGELIRMTPLPIVRDAVFPIIGQIPVTSAGTLTLWTRWTWECDKQETWDVSFSKKRKRKTIKHTRICIRLGPKVWEHIKWIHVAYIYLELQLKNIWMYVQNHMINVTDLHSEIYFDDYWLVVQNLKYFINKYCNVFLFFL